MPLIRLQPKQAIIDDLLAKGSVRVIGAGGGRGAAKSGMIDRCALIRLLEEPGISVCIVMRTYEQLRKYHIDQMNREWPQMMEAHYKKTDKKLRLPVGDTFSELDLGYAENYDAVEQFFRSANYKYIFVDQAEQFIEPELREMRKACRWPSGGAKIVLSHNMGGVGIQTLRKWFHLKEYNEREDPASYKFVKFNPWDNVEWVREALKQDGKTERDYYSWTDEERQLYAALRGEYTQELASDDDALRNRDWLGSWDALEGAYFGSTYDRQATMVTPVQMRQILKPWHAKWMSQDWGKAHYCVTYWHGRATISPREAYEYLGWNVDVPVDAVVTHREWVSNEMTGREIGQGIGQRTPEGEKQQSYFLSPDAFGDRGTEHTIAQLQGEELKKFGLPLPIEANNSRISGWQLMADCLEMAKVAAGKVNGRKYAGEPVWLISSDCPELLNALPLAMRDPKNLDDILKTDKAMARLEQDVIDSARYGLQSYMSPRAKPLSVQAEEYYANLSPAADMTAKAVMMAKWKHIHTPKRRSSWASRQ